MTVKPLGAAIGLLADRLLGEPPASVHPVAHFGRLMKEVELAIHRDARHSGIVYTSIGVAVGLAAGRVAGSTALAVGTASAGRMLRDEARAIRAELGAGRLDAARERLPALVGRNPFELDESGVAAAVIESVAENTVDAVVAPALWGAAFGAPAVFAYRAVNTMDAMVGHHSEQYERFGWASARADDVANLMPARATAALVCLVAPRCAGRVVTVVGRDASAHPSPNAGVAEAAFAAALGVELGGTVQYGERVECRPPLGTGPRPRADDIDRAVALANRVELLLMVLLAAAGFALLVRGPA